MLYNKYTFNKLNPRGNRESAYRWAQ